MCVDFDLVAHHVDRGNISVQRHPTEPLRIFNYTQQCQWSKAWDDVTRTCRGLIVDDDDLIVARPFPKFFNLGEHADGSYAGPIDLIPPVTVFDKLDGSLGIAYRRPSDGRIAWATRGSFTSEQALWATAWWADHGDDAYMHQGEGRTVLGEIVYPANRIVVDYRGYEGIVLLATLRNDNGCQVIGTSVHQWPGRMVQRFEDVAHTALPSRPNTEGYVLLSGDALTRVKVKEDEYVRLHRILTGVSTKTIWEALAAGDSLDKIIDGVPDEFLAWVEQTADNLHAHYQGIEQAARDTLDRVKDLPTRKDQAAALADEPNKSLVFALLDGKDLAPRIWRLIRPAHELPFTKDIDA